MVNMKSLFVIIGFCLTIIVTSTVGSEDWKDPHDMNTNAKAKYMNTPSLLKRSSSAPGVDTPEGEVTTTICVSNLKRIVGILMKSVHIDKVNPELYQGHIRFTVDPEDLKFLLNFGSKDVTFDTLLRLDTIFSEGFKRSYIEKYLDNLKSFQLAMFSAVKDINELWILGSAFMLYLVYKLFKNNFSVRYVVGYLFFLVLITDYGFRYHYLVQEAEDHNMKVTYSSKCDSIKMSWSEWVTFMFVSQDCEQRYVTPLDTLLYQVKHIIIIPMHAMGTGMGGFGSNLFSSMPFPLNLIMWPIMLIFTIVLILVVLTIVSDRTIDFNFLHLFKIKFGSERCADNTLTNSNTEKLLDKILERSAVQNVQVSVLSGRSHNKSKRESRTVKVGLDQPKKQILAKEVDKSIENDVQSSKATSDTSNLSLEDKKNKPGQCSEVTTKNDKPSFNLKTKDSTNTAENDERVEIVSLPEDDK